MRIACWALHYGKEYLAWSVRSVQDAVDELHVFYTPRPSYGFHDRGLTCPDTEGQLYEAAHKFATKPVIWHRIKASNEGEHRQLMHVEAQRRGAELYVVVDSDEVWDPNGLSATLDYVSEANSAGRWLARFCNFWRSWRWIVSDGFRPVRVVDLRHPLTVDAYLDETMQPEPVFHFGYAQNEATMRYKVACHGHLAEFRPNYLDTLFFPWRPGCDLRYLHPTSLQIWEQPEATPASVLETLDAILYDHPYRAVELIV